MGFFRKEYWSVLPFPPPGDLPNPGIKPKFPVSFAFANVFLTYLATWEVHRRINNKYFFFKRQKKTKKKPDIYCLTFSNFQNLSAKYLAILGIQFSTVQSLSRVWLFATPWTAACQSSLSITNSHSLPKFMLIESVMPSSHLIFCCPLLLPPSVFPSIRIFILMSQPFASGGQSIGASASALPMNIQDWFPLGLTGLISLQSKGLSRAFSNTTVQKYQFFSTQFVFYGPTLTSIHDYWKNHSFD